MSHFSEFLKVWRWAINIKKACVLKSNERGTVLMWILWCLDCVLVTCSAAQYFKKLMNRRPKNDTDKGSWQDSWEVISIKWMYYKEKQEKLWIGNFFLVTVLCLSEEHKLISDCWDLDDMSNIMEITPQYWENWNST